MIQLFQNNYFKSNIVTCHFIKISNSAVNSSISRKKLENENRIKSLGVNIHDRLNFDYHMEQICIKAVKIASIIKCN